MLDGDHYRTAELVNQLMNVAIKKEDLQIIEALKPSLTVSDGKYRYEYQNILFGYGETVNAAMMDFNNNFYNKKP